MQNSASATPSTPLTPEQQRIVQLETAQQAMLAQIATLLQQVQSGASSPSFSAAPRTPTLPTIAKPGKYDGLSPTKLESWLREIEQQLQWYAASMTTPAQQVLFASSHLTDSALDWWTCDGH